MGPDPSNRTGTSNLWKGWELLERKGLAFLSKGRRTRRSIDSTAWLRRWTAPTLRERKRKTSSEATRRSLSSFSRKRCTSSLLSLFLSFSKREGARNPEDRRRLGRNRKRGRSCIQAPTRNERERRKIREPFFLFSRDPASFFPRARRARAKDVRFRTAFRWERDRRWLGPEGAGNAFADSIRNEADPFRFASSSFDPDEGNGSLVLSSRETRRPIHARS